MHAQVSPMSDASTHVPDIFHVDDHFMELPGSAEEEEDSNDPDLQECDQASSVMQASDARKQLLQEMLAEAKYLYHKADPTAQDCENLLDSILGEVKHIYFNMYGQTVDMEQEFSDCVQQYHPAWMRVAMCREFPEKTHFNHRLKLASQSRQEMLEGLLEEVKHLHLQSEISNKEAREERLHEMLQDVMDMYLTMYGRTDATFSEVSDHVGWVKWCADRMHADGPGCYEISKEDTEGMEDIEKA
jgi:hypothetical protein